MEQCIFSAGSSSIHAMHWRHAGSRRACRMMSSHSADSPVTSQAIVNLFVWRPFGGRGRAWSHSHAHQCERFIQVLVGFVVEKET